MAIAFTEQKRQAATEDELINNSLAIAEFCTKDTDNKLVCYSCFEDMMANLLRLRELRGNNQ